MAKNHPNNLLREAENGMDAVNPFAELKSAWAKYTTTASMFLSRQNVIIMITYEESEFSLSVVFVELYRVVDRKCTRRFKQP